jgi:hypothetical protein
MSHKFFTVEEANALVGFLEVSIERIRRNKQRFLWLQQEISILRLIVECGANTSDGRPKDEQVNPDAVALGEKLRQFEAVQREID